MVLLCHYGEILQWVEGYFINYKAAYSWENIHSLNAVAIYVSSREQLSFCFSHQVSYHSTEKHILWHGFVSSTLDGHQLLGRGEGKTWVLYVL